jgi:hypothetical protein
MQSLEPARRSSRVHPSDYAKELACDQRRCSVKTSSCRARTRPYGRRTRPSRLRPNKMKRAPARAERPSRSVTTPHKRSKPHLMSIGSSAMKISTPRGITVGSAARQRSLALVVIVSRSAPDSIVLSTPASSPSTTFVPRLCPAVPAHTSCVIRTTGVDLSPRDPRPTGFFSRGTRGQTPSSSHHHRRALAALAETGTIPPNGAARGTGARLGVAGRWKQVQQVGATRSHATCSRSSTNCRGRPL